MHANTQLLKKQSFASTDAAGSGEGSKRAEVEYVQWKSVWAQGTGCSNESRNLPAIRIDFLVS